jgi:cell division protein FtsZ
VLNGAVAGIAEIINCPGMVNVDFADVRTVMRENGMAMMGSAFAEGAERSQRAAEAAIHSPLLEDIHLSGARGVLVNITGPRSMKLKEVKEAMSVIKSVCADDATIIYGSVFDDNLTDGIRVTVVATGLGPLHQQRRPEIVVNNTQAVASGLRTGTHDAAYFPQSQAFAPTAPVSAPAGGPMGSADGGWTDFETPSAVRSRRGGGGSPSAAAAEVQSVDNFSRRTLDMDALDIPAFIRKQAD